MSLIDIRQVVDSIVDRERNGETLLVPVGPLELFTVIGTIQLASRHPEFQKTLSHGKMRRLCDRLCSQFFSPDETAIISLGWDNERTWT